MAYHLASRGTNQSTLVDAGRARFGDGAFTLIAGPCAIESAMQIEQTARFVAENGTPLLRGGAYKPRTSPYDFQGLGDEGVRMIGDAARRAGVGAVVEVLSSEQLPLLCEQVSMLQIGARNMQNFELLRAAARTRMPILLKRAASATLDELLYAAEYVLAEGNPHVVLCERGVRGFDRHTRNLLDLAGAVRLKELTHLPVIADPSHGTGRASLIEPMVLAAAAAGLDGAIVEIHPDPSVAKCDAEQALDFPGYTRLVEHLAMLREVQPSKVRLSACR